MDDLTNRPLSHYIPVIIDRDRCPVVRTCMWIAAMSIPVLLACMYSEEIAGALDTLLTVWTRLLGM